VTTETRSVRPSAAGPEFRVTVWKPETIEDMIELAGGDEQNLIDLAYDKYVLSLQAVLRRVIESEGLTDPEDPDALARLNEVAQAYRYRGRVRVGAGSRRRQKTVELSEDQFAEFSPEVLRALAAQGVIVKVKAA
jgi:hypothetical protein